MFIDKVSRHLGLTILKADMSEEDFWPMALEAPEGFVAGWPFADGTARFAVKSKHLKSFLAVTATRRKKATPSQNETGTWETPREQPAGLARYRRNWQ